MKTKLRILSLFIFILVIPFTIPQDLCPSLPRNSDGLKLQCQYNGQASDCSTTSAPGTLASYNCEENYTSNRGSNNNVYSMICQTSGNWSEQDLFQVFRCHLLNKGTCGKLPKFRVQTFIIGGDTTNSEDWPWNAAIFQNNIFACGGSLINSSVILTAGHCVAQIGTTEKLPTTVLQVILGASSSSYADPGRNAQKFNVKHVELHPEYNKDKSYLSDIALIFLDNDVVFNEFVSPVCLPEGEDVVGSDMTPGEVVGFGTTEPIYLGVPRPSAELIHTNLPFVPFKTCLADSDGKLAANSRFCAGFDSGPVRAVCKGDSGGGFVLKEDIFGNGPRYYVEGIVSTTATGRGCLSYGLFTKVRFFITWIRDQMNNYIPGTTNQPSPKSISFDEGSSDALWARSDASTIALDLHNKYRSVHGAPPVKLSPWLSTEAQTWADTLININDLYTKTDEKYDQNIFEHTIIDPGDLVTRGVEHWYSTKSSYNPIFPTSSSFPFTRLVWKSTREIGVGVSVSFRDKATGGRTVLVLCYSPKQNLSVDSSVGYATQLFSENVQV